MFNRIKLIPLQNGINTFTYFVSPVHDHKMPRFFYGKCWFYIFNRKHVVIIAVNMIDMWMLPVIFPVNGLVNGPGGIGQINLSSKTCHQSFFFLRLQTKHFVLDGLRKLC